MSANAAHFDDNQVPTVMGVIGTLGTADTGGTATALPFAVDPDTGAGWVKIINGTVTTTLALNSGTITTGSLTNLAMLHAGTITSLPQVSIGTIPQVSIGTLPTLNLSTGTVDRIQDVGTLGSVSNIGIIHNAGTISAIPQVSVGTIPQVSIGTLPTLNLTTGTITTGSLSNIAQVHNAGTLAAGDNNIGNVDIVTGTVTLLSTVTTVSNLTNLAGGTVQINKTPVSIGTPYHVRGTTGVAVWGTVIAASGAGTYQYVSNVDIVVASGTVDVAVTSIGVGGSTGAGVVARGQFTPGGGIAKQFDPIHRSGTNGTLSYWLGGAGTVDIDINYWQGV